MFLCIHAINQGNSSLSRFLSFPNAKEAENYIKQWLESACGVDWDENGDMPFVCPNVEGPADLAKYNGYYHYDGFGSFQLFTMPIYDEDSAKRFSTEVIREFGLDKVFEEEADEMIDMLEHIKQSFTQNIDCTTATQKIDELIQNEGLRLF